MAGEAGANSGDLGQREMRLKTARDAGANSGDVVIDSVDAGTNIREAVGECG